MTTDRAHLNALARLGRLTEGDARRAAWRQSMATLAALVTNRATPVPLEGCDPQELQDGARIALTSGLVDDLSWLSPPAAAAALYELAAALPPGDVKRELGRRVLTRLHSGDAATFVALATQLALGSRRALSGTSVRARVALALDLPLGLGARADALALALISRRELSREWLAIPATGALPGRRLAARLLERAAREAVRRASEGDDSGVRIFETPEVRAPWGQLLSDRESLVWRHVAAARGLLASSIPDLGETMELHTDPQLTPTEWRRAAASLAAHIAIDPERALDRCSRLLESEVQRRDRGVAGAMVLGLPRAVEAHPDEAEAILSAIVQVGGIDSAEALVDLLRERLSEGFAQDAVDVARARLRRERDATPAHDDGRLALIDSLLAELSPEIEAVPTLHAEVTGALAAFTEHGAAEAHHRAGDILSSVEARVALIEGGDDGDSRSRRATFQALREVDAVLFETDTLVNLLTLGVRDTHATGGTRSLGDLFERMTNWLVLREYEPIAKGGTVPHFTLRMRRLRTMLHLVDADGAHVEHRTDALRRRRLLTTQVLLHRVRNDAETPLRRALGAATARACDALVREEVAELSDVLLVAGMFITDPDDLQTLAEASMMPELEAALRAYSRLQDITAAAPRSAQGARRALEGLLALAQELPVASSPRVEALRADLLAVGNALEQVASVPSLQALAAGTDDRLLSPLEVGVQALAELVAGARRRLGMIERTEAPASGPALRLLDLCVERALRGDGDGIGDALASVAEALGAELPGPMADAVLLTLETIWRLPMEAPEGSPVHVQPARQRQAPLPPWMPPSRTLGGFHVLRPLGSGAGGTVFIARRVHERHDPTAERFALKVPEYDGTAARTLSEEEFLQMFRQEASALLALPHHPNIARFVTFDAGTRPKPILVMELVEGPTLERHIERGDMSMPRALSVLGGLLDGLDAMHRAGIGHLDVKPGNVILRDPDGMAGPLAPGAPVLVDFGLAGHHIRPGCATAHYGAPEIWSATEGGAPQPADVYAFGCVAFEVLTGRTLFTGPHEMALVTAHLSHDGVPAGIAEMAAHPATADLAEWLAGALRQRADQRTSVTALRRQLAQLHPALERQPWPLLHATA
jgi:eukaryotic-like serine/threonine-protein kinase